MSCFQIFFTLQKKKQFWNSDQLNWPAGNTVLSQILTSIWILNPAFSLSLFSVIAMLKQVEDSIYFYSCMQGKLNLLDLDIFFLFLKLAISSGDHENPDNKT